MALRSSKFKLVALCIVATLLQFSMLGESSPLDSLRTYKLNFVLIGLAGLFGLGAAFLALKARRAQSIVSKLAAYTFTYVLAINSILCLTALAGSAQRLNAANLVSAGLYVIGLCWLVWYVDTINRTREHSQQEGFVENVTLSQADEHHKRIWDPLDIRAWFYGHNNNNKLNQSVTILLGYSLLFMVVGMLTSWSFTVRESDDSPEGGGGGSGGGPVQMAAFKQKVQIKKVVRKKFVINPYSSIIFTPPEIDNVALNIDVATEHLYQAGGGKGGAGMGKGNGFGVGDGDGSGFGDGTGSGKIKFIRLEYPGGDWNQDFGIGADLNMLIQYGVMTSQKVEDQTESRTIAQLHAFEPKKSPRFVYLTGQRNITLSKNDVKILREYLLDRRGMIFADNGGSQHFHNQLFAAMRQILPEVEPVKVPLDDVIHRVPYALPFLPIVAPHGGRDAYGWKVDGRWVCYYHPGDIGDAWSDGHSGVPHSIYDACYRLGANIIFYAYAERAKWNMSQQGKK